jgi:hypothetical protein
MNGLKENKIILLPSFEREANRLSKRYPSLRNDLTTLIISIRTNPKLGIPLGGGVIKFGLRSKAKERANEGEEGLFHCISSEIMSCFCFLSTINQIRKLFPMAG